MNVLKIFVFLIAFALVQGCADKSNPVTKTTTVPPAPALRTPVNTSTGNTQPVTVGWNKSSGAETYKLQVVSDSLFTNLVFRDSLLTDTVKILPVLSNLTQYYWKVSAVNSAGASVYSAAFTFTTADSVAKSVKRGIAFDLSSAADISAISRGISWWYNWGTTPNSKVAATYLQTYKMDFVPMLWGGSPTSESISSVEKFIMAHPEVQYLLVMNEPNLIDQANRTPAQAAADWVAYEQVAYDMQAQGRTIYLVGPAMNWGNMSGYANPVTWLDAFYAAYRGANNGKDPKIDYLAFHWYDYGLSSQLDALKKYGKKIWVTEMANWNTQINSYAKQQAQMRDMVNICETRSDVFRYAWFYGRGGFPDTRFTYLFTEVDGQLSELGKYYISLPNNN